MTTPTMPLDCDGFADALADYLEGDAPDGVRTAVESHAGSCAACKALLADLTNITATAATLPQLSPSRDLWSGIAARIDTPVIAMDAPRAVMDIPRRRGWARPAMAAAALVLVTAGITYVLTRASLADGGVQQVAITTPDAPRSTPVVVTAPNAVAPTVAEPTAEIASSVTERPTGARLVSRSTPAPLPRNASAEVAMSHADSIFATEIGKLRLMVRSRRDQLDPRTVAVLDQSIAVIDSAIAQSRAALAKDPASGFLATQLNHSLEKKVELLRTVASLPSRT
jgi:hypothetical protein